MKIDLGQSLVYRKFKKLSSGDEQQNFAEILEQSFVQETCQHRGGLDPDYLTGLKSSELASNPEEDDEEGLFNVS